jgi:hypothetical protein
VDNNSHGVTIQGYEPETNELIIRLSCDHASAPASSTGKTKLVATTRGRLTYTLPDGKVLALSLNFTTLPTSQGQPHYKRSRYSRWYDNYDDGI